MFADTCASCLGLATTATAVEAVKAGAQGYLLKSLEPEELIGNLEAAARGEAAWVNGDGRQTVAQLVEAQLNNDPRRGESEDHPLGRIDVRQDGSIVADLRRRLSERGRAHAARFTWTNTAALLLKLCREAA